MDDDTQRVDEQEPSSPIPTESRARFEAQVAIESALQPLVAATSLAPHVLGGPVQVIVSDSAPKNYVRPDILILDDVARALADNPTLEASDLKLECSNGKLTATGSVPRRADRDLLEFLLAGTFGVRGLDLTNTEIRRDMPEPTPEQLTASVAGTSHAEATIHTPEPGSKR